MIRTSLRKALKNKERLLGTVITLPSPDLVECVIETGYDWIFFDLEHSSLSLSEVKLLLQVVAQRVYSVIRVPNHEEAWIKRSLDLGVDGLLIPQIRNTEQMRSVIKYSKYAPCGERSVGFGRAHKYGLGFAEYVREANDSVALIPQIEHKEGVENIDEIISLEEVDGIFIGSYDLSGSYGKPGAINDSEVQSAISFVEEVARKNDLPLSSFAGDPHKISLLLERGYSFPALGIDTMLYAQTMKKNIELLQEILS